MKKTLLVASVCAAAAIALLVGVQSSDGAWRTRAQAGFSGQSTLASSPDSATGTESNRFTASLPQLQRETQAPRAADDAPVAQMYAALRPAALLGNANAACRLVAGLQKCFEAQLNLESASNISHQPANPANRESAAGLLRSYEVASQGCEAVSDAMIAESYRFQAIAASSGNPQMQRWLAAKPALDPRKFVQELDQWKDYQSRAQKYYNEALKNRRAEDLGALLLVYAPADAPVPRPPFKMPDTATFLALVDVATQRGMPIPSQLSHTAQELRESLSPDQQRALEERRLSLSSGWQSTQPQESPFRSLLLPEASVCQ